MNYEYKWEVECGSIDMEALKQLTMPRRPILCLETQDDNGDFKRFLFDIVDDEVSVDEHGNTSHKLTVKPYQP